MTRRRPQKEPPLQKNKEVSIFTAACMVRKSPGNEEATAAREAAAAAAVNGKKM